MRTRPWGRSSAGRASQWHCEGQGFDPPRLHHSRIDASERAHPPDVEGAAMSAYVRLVSIRRLFAFVLALSVLFAPGVAGAAMAASPHHDMAMMEAGHCQSPPSNSGDHKMGGKSCCIAMCMAIAVAPSTPAESSPQRQQLAQFTP